MKFRHPIFDRTGDYRAIYTINPNTINPTQNQAIVLFVGHRKKVYDDFTKTLKITPSNSPQATLETKANNHTNTI